MIRSKLRRRNTWPFDLTDQSEFVNYELQTKFLDTGQIKNQIKPSNNNICTCSCSNVKRNGKSKFNSFKRNWNSKATRNDELSETSQNKISTKFSFITKKLRESTNTSSPTHAIATNFHKINNSEHSSHNKTNCNNEHRKLSEVTSISPPGKSGSSASILTNRSSDNCLFSPNGTTTGSNSISTSHHRTNSTTKFSIPQQKRNTNKKIPIHDHHHHEAIPENVLGFQSTRALNLRNNTNGTATGAMSLQVTAGPNGDVRKVITLWQNYYPEGQWGWIVLLCAFIVQSINHGSQLAFSTLSLPLMRKYDIRQPEFLGWLGAMSMGISLFLSPIWVSICKRKSTRLSAVFGGLVASLGCLFTSFASQFHQLFFSYGAFLGVGVGLTRDASSLMVGQYFKRKRELVEILVVSGSGLGILLMSISIHTAISSLGWRIGLQAITGSLFLTFFLGTCYRSASLYHPQRRAILHLKNQKRKVKEKEKRNDEPPFLDFSCLRSKTLQILLVSCAFTAFGINTPLFYLAIEYENELKKGNDNGLELGVGTGIGIPVNDFSLVLLHIGVGASWIIGCFLFGLIVLQKNQECRVSKQYLCQMASVICGISILALTAVEGFNGLVTFSCVYGFSLGGYNYALKVYTYERVRARHFPRAWSFIQSSQAIPLVLGVPLTGYMNSTIGYKAGYYFSAFTVIIGSGFLFLADVRRRKLSRRKTQNSSMKTCETLESAQSPKIRRLSFAFPVEQISPQSKPESRDPEGGQAGLDPALLAKELTCISEEGIADMDFQDIYFEEWAEYFGDCITSCNKVENCLVSEFDPDYPILLDRRSRRWSAARAGLAGHPASIGATAAAVAGGIAGLGTIGQNLNTNNNNNQPGTSGSSGSGTSTANQNQPRVFMPAPREIPVFNNRNHPRSRAVPSRSITVIEEAEASV